MTNSYRLAGGATRKRRELSVVGDLATTQTRSFANDLSLSVPQPSEMIGFS